MKKLLLVISIVGFGLTTTTCVHVVAQLLNGRFVAGFNGVEVNWTVKFKGTVPLLVNVKFGLTELLLEMVLEPPVGLVMLQE